MILFHYLTNINKQSARKHRILVDVEHVQRLIAYHVMIQLQNQLILFRLLFLFHSVIDHKRIICETLL